MSAMHAQEWNTKQHVAFTSTFLFGSAPLHYLFRDKMGSAYQLVTNHVEFCGLVYVKAE